MFTKIYLRAWCSKINISSFFLNSEWGQKIISAKKTTQDDAEYAEGKERIDNNQL